MIGNSLLPHRRKRHSISIDQFAILLLVPILTVLIEPSAVRAQESSDPSIQAEPGTEKYQRLKSQGELQAKDTKEATDAVSPGRRLSETAKSNGEGLIVPVDSMRQDSLAANDDGFTSAISLGFDFVFYDSTRTEVYINNNGNLSFGSAESTFTPEGFPSSNYVMIAPFWADVDTGGSADSTDTGIAYYQVDPEAERLVVTWDSVGYYNEQTDKLNTFQVIISKKSDTLTTEGKNLCFAYGNMEWTTGDASGGTDGFGGTPATVGVNKGDGEEYALVGRFDTTGTAYDGPGGDEDGVDYLDEQRFCFDVSNASNVPPLTSDFPDADTLAANVGGTLRDTVNFTGPEETQTISASVSHDIPNFTTEVSDGNPAEIAFTFSPTSDQAGETYAATFSGTDDGTPSETTEETLYFQVSGSPPEADVQPESLSETLALGDSSEQSLEIANVATGEDVGDLSYEVQIASSNATSQTKSKTDIPDGDEPVEYDSPLGPAESVTEEIGWSSPNDGYDWYCTVGTAGQEVTLDVERTSGDIIPNLAIALGEVEDGAPFSEFPDGLTATATNTSSSTSSLTYTPQEDGTLTVVVSTYTSESGGDYSLSASGVDRPSSCGGASWVDIRAASGSVAPGSEDSVDVQFSGTSTPPGEYEALLRVVTNDPEQDTTDVPVSLTVEQPGITLNNPSELPSPGQDASVTVDFPSDFAPASARFFYRPAGDRTFRDTTRTLSDVAAGGAASFSIPAEAVTQAGVQYYVQVEGSASGVQESVTFSVPLTAPDETGFLPVQRTEASAQGAFEAETYRMVTVPFDAGDRSVFDVLEQQYGSYDPAEWKLARWSAEESAYRFGSAIDSLRPGEAAWLITAAGDTLSVSNARSADASGPRSVQLGPGWTQIGTPFSFPVPWAEVEQLMSPEVLASVRTPMAYDTSGYRDVTQLRPWRGAFVLNTADTSVTIEIPPVAAEPEQEGSRGKSLARAASEADGYRLQMVASAYRGGQTLQDPGTWVGFAEGADAGFGPRDRAKPPSIRSGPRLRVTPEEGPGLARSLKPLSSGGAAWDLEVGLAGPVDGAQEVTIALNEKGARPSGFKRYVVDRDRGRRLPVTNGSVQVSLTEGAPRRELRVIVGTEAFAERKSEGASLAIEETKLRASAPNPFAEATTLAYQLAGEKRVRVAVYDVLGRRVQTLVDERQEAGVHEVEWRPGAEAGLASGVYFCRMKAGDYTATRKLVFVR